VARWRIDARLPENRIWRFQDPVQENLQTGVCFRTPCPHFPEPWAARNGIGFKEKRVAITIAIVTAGILNDCYINKLE
jgi:hypothetical protein